MRQILFEIDGKQFKQDKPTVLRYDGKTMTLVRGNQLIFTLLEMEAKWIRQGLHPNFPMIYEPDRVTTIPGLLLTKYKGKILRKPERLPVKPGTIY